jgi:hypothetical protein
VRCCCSSCAAAAHRVLLLPIVFCCCASCSAAAHRVLLLRIVYCCCPSCSAAAHRVLLLPIVFCCLLLSLAEMKFLRGLFAQRMQSELHSKDHGSRWKITWRERPNGRSAQLTAKPVRWRVGMAGPAVLRPRAPPPPPPLPRRYNVALRDWVPADTLSASGKAEHTESDFFGPGLLSPHRTRRSNGIGLSRGTPTGSWLKKKSGSSVDSDSWDQTRSDPHVDSDSWVRTRSGSPVDSGTRARGRRAPRSDSWVCVCVWVSCACVRFQLTPKTGCPRLLATTGDRGWGWGLLGAPASCVLRAPLLFFGGGGAAVCN